MSRKKTPKPATREALLMVGIPAGETMATLTCQSLLGLCLTVSSKTTFNFAVGSLVYDARNQISYGAVETGADYLLWVDSDMVFEADAVLRLHQTMTETGADLVTALCTTRKAPIKPVIYKALAWDEVETEQGPAVKITREEYRDYPRDSVFEIAGCGFGFVLTKVSAFKALWERNEQPFAPMPMFGEDLSACIRMKRAGAKLVCDSRVKVGHIGQFVVTEDDIDPPEEASKE